MSLLTINSRLLRSLPTLRNIRAMSQLGDLGEGAGKGGGGGGAIRSAGGAFGKLEAAREEEYFYKLQQSQLHKLKDMLEDDIKFHEERIRVHQEALEKAKAKLGDIKK